MVDSSKHLRLKGIKRNKKLIRKIEDTLKQCNTNLENDEQLVIGYSAASRGKIVFEVLFHIDRELLVPIGEVLEAVDTVFDCGIHLGLESAENYMEKVMGNNEF